MGPPSSAVTKTDRDVSGPMGQHPDREVFAKRFIRHSVIGRSMLRIAAILALLTIACLAIVPMNGSNTGVDVPEEELPWWETTSMDMDRNHIHDSLEARSGRWFDLFIRYDHDPTDADVENLERLGLEVYSVFDSIDSITLYNVERPLIDTIVDLPNVVMVEEQPWLVATLDVAIPTVKARPNDLYHDVWEELGYNGTDVTIAILDTGVDDQHESLDGKFVAGVDVSNPPLIITGNPDDGNGHGTHCAGIAMGDGGATDDDSDGEPDYQGAAPGARLVDVKISTDLGVSAGTLQEGIRWCIDNKDQHSIDILSISFGQVAGDSDGSDATCQLVDNATEQGLVVVIAAGNEGPDNDGIGSPAAATTAITVANIDDFDTLTRSDDEIHSSSSRGPRADDGDEDPYDELKPEIAAPGSDIMSCDYSPAGQYAIGYTSKTGTSMACPMISGIAALMLDAKGELTPQEVKDVIILTAEKKGEPYYPDLSDKWNREWGYGFVDAYWAVSVALNGGTGNGGVIDESISCMISIPSHESTISGMVNVSGIASIASGDIDHVEVWWDDLFAIQADPEEEDWSKWYLEFDTNDFEDGEHQIGVRAISGARSSEDYVINITVDNSGSDSDEDDGFLGLPAVSPFIALPLAILVFGLRRRRY